MNKAGSRAKWIYWVGMMAACAWLDAGVLRGDSPPDAARQPQAGPAPF